MTVDPIFAGVKNRAEAVNPHRHQTKRRYVGSIDVLTAQNWAKECGFPVGTKGFQAYAKQKLQSNEYQHFRAAKDERKYHNGHDLPRV